MATATKKYTKQIIGGIVIAAVFFVAGMTVQKHVGSNSQNGQPGALSDANGTRGGGRGGFGGAGGRARGAGFAMGQIISSDDKSITLQMQDGGSKIVYLTGNTPVMKATLGKRSDLANGVTVIVNGAPNQDGSIAAQTIQIRPAGTAGFGGGARGAGATTPPVAQ